jgi:hypothetical protein
MNELLGALPVEVASPTDVFLSEKAGAIRALGKNIVRDVIEIGRHLTEVKVRVGHGNFRSWIKREFEWERSTADNFINMHEAFGSNAQRVGHLDLPMSAFYAIAAPTTPTEVRDQLLDKAEGGERLTRDQVRAAIDKALVKQQEELLGKLHAEALRREAAVRAEYEGKMFVDPDELSELIDKELRPLQKQIAGYEEKSGERSARNYMSADEAFGKSATVADLRGWGALRVCRAGKRPLAPFGEFSRSGS